MDQLNRAKEPLTLNVRRLSSFWPRLRGLLGSEPLTANDWVWIVPCRQVHTFGMRYSIDVVHLDRSGRVLIVETLAPWRLGRYNKESHSVVELGEGAVGRVGIAPGMCPFLRVEGAGVRQDDVD